MSIENAESDSFLAEEQVLLVVVKVLLKFLLFEVQIKKLLLIYTAVRRVRVAVN